MHDCAVANIRKHILKKENHVYFVKEVKAPLMQALIITTGKVTGFINKLLLLREVWRIVRSIQRYPEPTRDNVKKQMSQVVLDIWDGFFKLGNNPGRNPLFRAVKRVFVSELEHDGYYSQRLTWFLKQLALAYLDGRWAALESWCPTDCWNDPVVVEELRKAAREFRQNLTVCGRDALKIEV